MVLCHWGGTSEIKAAVIPTYLSSSPLMSNHWDTNSPLNSYFGHISQQQYFSWLRADDGIASLNGNTGTYYHAYDGSDGMSAVSGHPTPGSLETQPEYSWVSTIQSNKIFFYDLFCCEVNHNQAENNFYLTASHQHVAQTVAITQHFGKDQYLFVELWSMLTRPVNHVPPTGTPPAYTDVGDPPIASMSPIETMYALPVHGLAAGQGPAISSPTTTRNVNPSFITFRSYGVTRYRCECTFETSRKTDLIRHHDGTKHAGTKYCCSVPNCTKSYTRKYALEKHKRRH